MICIRILKKVSTSFFSNPEGKRFYFSAKDIFNTYVYPTEMGSQTFKDFFQEIMQEL